MEFTLDQGQGTYKIESYDQNGIKINGKVYQASLLLMPEKIILPWGPRSFKDLAIEHFDEMLALQPEVVLLGTGDNTHYPNPKLYSKLIAQSIGVEIMSNGAACRTYTILMTEGRHVLAAFII